MLIDLKRNKDSGEMKGVAEDFRTEGKDGKGLSRNRWIEVKVAQ